MLTVEYGHTVCLFLASVDDAVVFFFFLNFLSLSFIEVL